MTDPTTNPSTLPQWRGQPVPWVTRWSAENQEHVAYGATPRPDGSLAVSYKGGKGMRDHMGVLWLYEGIRRGGEPEWRRVSTYRQRACMIKGLCQVCGKKIQESPIEWLMPFDGIEQWSSNVSLTMQPPTCAACIPLALDVCPNLRKRGWMILRVLEFTPWGIYGEVPYLNDEGKLVRTMGAASYTDPEAPLRGMVARQMVVKLVKYTVKERGGGEQAEHRAGAADGVVV